MDGTIRYDYGSNYGHLDDIASAIQGAQECREGLIGALNALGGSGALVGQTADQHHTLQMQCAQNMDGIHTDMHATHQRATECQITNAQLDNRCAGSF
jgi:hypothetical protein